MSIYKCSVCGYIYDESKNDKTWDELSEDWECPVCTKGRSYFGKISTVYYEEDEKIAEDIVEDESKLNTEKEGDLNYLSTYLRRDDEVEKHMDIIHEMAVTGKSIIEPMRTKLPVISWDDILIMGAQLNPLPLNEHDEVNTTTIIGKKAKKPMIIENPVYISHMSFGALSKELKIALAKGAAQNKTAMCSGEGGILPEEKEASYKYIFEYVPNKYSVTEENLKNSDAIEIKIGQGTKPGMGGHLPGEKVTEEIAKVRNKPVGQDVISPSCFEEIQSKEDLKKLVDELREVSEGRPIGVKISAGHIEKDMEFIAYSKPDFVTIDGRGGATGASPKLLKDATSIPTIFALYRARKYIDTHGLDIDLVITGGLRISTDFAKAIAMGADAVAIASSALMAAACQQYRICGSGKCPVGVAIRMRN
ncbi:glutamate synthase-related protein [Clostridioides difficile]|uniref:glutamate synthase-related protein n=1 Tax=Clostridioides difficile TaxID=1496 RepID=UPI002E8DE7C8|nr:glutamate synthase-related protein [Clostridioides difficile]